MTKNSLCSCPQTCKLITSWVNSVKTVDFQGTHFTPSSTPLRYTANKWEGPLFTNCPTSTFYGSCLLFVSVVRFSHALLFSSSCSMVARPCTCAGCGCAAAKHTPLTLYPCFCVRNTTTIPPNPLLWPAAVLVSSISALPASLSYARQGRASTETSESTEHSSFFLQSPCVFP